MSNNNTPTKPKPGLTINPDAESRMNEVELYNIEPSSARSNDSIDFQNELANRTERIESLGTLYEQTQARIQKSMDLIKQAENLEETKECGGGGYSDDEAVREAHGHRSNR